MNYLSELGSHAAAIRDLPDATRQLVLDALRVRSMDFVCDRLTDSPGDMAADVYRELVPSSPFPFNPDQYPA